VSEAPAPTPEDRRFLIAYDTALSTITASDLGKRGGKSDALGKVKARFAKDPRAETLAREMGRINLYHRGRLLGLPQPEGLAAELDAMFQEG
jgi:hypothetical protein